MTMRILTYVILILFTLIDDITPGAYTCNRRATCGCSKRSIVILSKIIGGEPVEIPHTWGWIASLRKDDLHICGASLIAPGYAITAAHCVHDVNSLSSLSLNFGITNISDIGQIYDITRLIVHPSYDPRLFTNDIALLRLGKPVDVTRSDISCICLPTPSDFKANSVYPPIGEKLIAIGWGTTDSSIRLPTPILRQVTVQAVARTDAACDSSINDDVVQFCAGVPEGGKDTCYGDSGGPLMMFTKGRWQLIGITSYGSNCAFPGFSGIYTRIAYFDSYIREIIDSENKLLPEGKIVADDKQVRSHTDTVYRTSLISFVLCIISIKYLYLN